MSGRQDEGQDFQQGGNLLPAASGMRLTSDSIQAPSSKNSPTGQLPAPKPSKGIGTQRGGPSVVEPSIAEAIRLDDPELTDAAILRSLPPSVASALHPVIREFIDPQYGFDYELTGYRLSGEVTTADRNRAGELLSAAMKPATIGVIRESLALLKAGTKSRGMDEGDLTLTMQVLTDECAEFPPDVVRAGCRRWMRREMWFPAVAELRNEMLRLVKNRQLIAAVLAGPP